MSYDPRHPETAMPRIKELIAQYDHLKKEMKDVVASADISHIERKGTLIIREIQLIVPRLRESLMIDAREARKEMHTRAIQKTEAVLAKKEEKAPKTAKPTAKAKK